MLSDEKSYHSTHAALLYFVAQSYSSMKYHGGGSDLHPGATRLTHPYCRNIPREIAVQAPVSDDVDLHPHFGGAWLTYVGGIVIGSNLGVSTNGLGDLLLPVTDDRHYPSRSLRLRRF